MATRINGKCSEETKKVCSEFAENWSVVGYRYVYFDHGIRKSIWFSLLVASTIFAVYLFYGSIVDYIKRDTYNVENVSYDATELEFPTVTICNINALNIGKARTAGLVNSVPEFNNKYRALINSNVRQTSEIDDDWFVKHNILSVREAFDVFQPSYDDMINNEIIQKIRPSGACLFNSSLCDRSDIRNSLTWEKSSKCYQYNAFSSGTASKVLQYAGLENGLQMIFHLDSENLAISEYDFQGLQLLIHPYGTPHFILEYTDLISLQAGSLNIITIEPKKVINLPEPYSTKCVDSAPYEVIEKFPYSKSMCEVDCILKKVLDKCNCVGFEFEGFVGSTPICTIKQMKCYLHYKATYKAERANTCKRTCSLECTTTKYNIRTEQVTIGNNDIYSRINRIAGWKTNYTKAETAFFIKENIVGINVAFSGINERTSTITPSVTWTELLGQIGGNLGLCMGLSILTAFELFFFLYDLLRSCKSDKEEKQTRGHRMTLT